MDLASGKAEFLNRNEFLGYSCAELEASKSILPLVHPDDVELVKSCWKQMVSGTTDEQSPIEYRLISKTGVWEWVQSRATTIKHDEQGKATQMLFTLTIITSRKKAKEELLAASLYCRSLIEASLDPLVTISKEGKITDVNKATEIATGCSHAELVGSDFSDYFTEPEKAIAGYQQVFTEGFIKDYPLVIRHKSGDVTDVLYNASIYRDPEGEIQGVFAAAREITGRKKLKKSESSKKLDIYSRNT